MNTFTFYLDKYNSDKGSRNHDFGKNVYDKLFDKLKESNDSGIILEIGIDVGSSINAMNEFFNNWKIIGLDIDNKSYLDNKNISTGILNQSNAEHLHAFYDHCINEQIQFDLILDDGSHHMEDQQLTFGYLFPLVRPGGYYIIEDLHTSLAQDGFILYNRHLDTKDWNKTTLGYLQNENLISSYLTIEQNDYIKNNVKDIIISDVYNDKQQPEWKFRSITSIIQKKKL